jgi:hypothetical protein
LPAVSLRRSVTSAVRRTSGCARSFERSIAARTKQSSAAPSRDSGTIM